MEDDLLFFKSAPPFYKASSAWMYLELLSGDQSFTLWRSDGWIEICFSSFLFFFKRGNFNEMVFGFGSRAYKQFSFIFGTFWKNTLVGKCTITVDD